MTNGVPGKGLFGPISKNGDGKTIVMDRVPREGLSSPLVEMVLDGKS